MTFLYAGLGLTMMAGIMAILEYSDSILKKSFNSIIPENNYIDTQYQKIDLELLNIIRNSNNSFGFDDQACSSIKYEINKSPQIKLLMNEYIIGSKSNSDHPDFKGSCILTDGIHRIIISPKDTNTGKYVLYSCVLDKKQYCNFENY